jgi:hypothetical protein
VGGEVTPHRVGLGREVAEERAAADARRVGHLVGGHVLEPQLGEQVERGLLDPGTGVLPCVVQHRGHDVDHPPSPAAGGGGHERRHGRLAGGTGCH